MEFRGLLTLSPWGVLCMKNALSQQHPQALPDRLEGQRSKDLYPPGSELWARELTLPQPGTPGYHHPPALGSLLTMDHQLGSPGRGARLVSGLALVVSAVRGRDGGQEQRAFVQHRQAGPATQRLGRRALPPRDLRLGRPWQGTSSSAATPCLLLGPHPHCPHPPPTQPRCKHH